MKFVNLGSSGLNVSAICIGGNSWGARGRRDWAAFDQSDSAPFFRNALDNGVNFFDTADAYNLGESERIIGETLMGYASRENIVLSTKVGLRMGDGVNQIGLGRKHLMESIDKQLKRLKTDYIDLYQLHWPERKVPRFGELDYKYDPNDNTWTTIEEVLYNLNKLVKSIIYCLFTLRRNKCLNLYQNGLELKVTVTNLG